MILIKDFKKILKEDIMLMINEGPDENNICRITLDNNQYDYRTIEDIFDADERSVGVTIL